MKCPKCGYLGFETTDRCRHCGYDFSLSVPVDLSSELPLRPPDEAESPLADFDLDRVIGEPEPRRMETAVGAATPPPHHDVQPYPSESDPAALPLFSRSRSPLDDALISAPPPARPPLAVRRATPEVARRRPPRTVRRDDDGLELQLESAGAPAAEEQSPVVVAVTPSDSAEAPKRRRLAAALIDVLLLGGINVAVLYLTLGIVGLSMADVFALPPIPMGAFLMLLNGGYLVAFTAANGQTIGKMLFGVRVIGDDQQRVDIPGAFLRTAGILLTLVTFGIAYLPALVSRDGRALHDRLARTRVIKHA